MPYGELMQIGTDLSEMIDADVRPRIKTPKEFSDALYDWAESICYDLDQTEKQTTNTATLAANGVNHE
jgi:hypothetical protein